MVRGTVSLSPLPLSPSLWGSQLERDSVTLLVVTQFGDLPVKDPAGEEPSEQPRSRIIAISVVALLAFALGVYWFLGRGDDAPPVETVVEAPPAVPPPPAPIEPDPEPVDIPALDESDTLLRALVAALSAHPGLAAWVVDDGIVRRFVVVVDNIADGANPAQHVTFLRPESRYTTTGEGATLRIDLRNYDRYDRHTQIIGSLDTRGSADLYLMMQPLIDEAYVELGNPDRPFIGTLERAVVNLLNVPIVDNPPPLIEHAPFFHYTDERLESLSPAQKQFLGMGPDNVRVVQAKLRQIALAIGIPDSRLP